MQKYFVDENKMEQNGVLLCYDHNDSDAAYRAAKSYTETCND